MLAGKNEIQGQETQNQEAQEQEAQKKEVKQITLPQLIKERVKGFPQLVYLSEVGFDSEFCTQVAWENFIKLVQQNPDINTVLLDGTLSRLNRPEFLTDEELFTYWYKSIEEAEEISKQIPNYEQFTTMAKIQLKILERHLVALKTARPDLQILLSTDSDATQFSFTYRLNEILVSKQRSLTEQIEKANSIIKKKKKLCTKAKSTLGALKRAEKSANKENAKVMSKIANSMTQQLDKLKAAEDDITTQRVVIETANTKLQLFRDSKIRPMHQALTRKLTKKIYENLECVCKRTKVKLVPGPTIIMINDMIIDYSHSRHFTWGVIKANDKNLLAGLVGTIPEYQKKVMRITGGHKTDIILQGHHGTGWTHVQRSHYQTDSLNFNDISRLDSSTTEEYLHFIVAPTFEDQVKVAEFLNTKRPDRMGPSGKAISTRNNPAVDRYRNGGVAGIVVMSKNELGIGKQSIAYQKFLDGSVLKQPEKYHAIMASSDEHMFHSAEDPLARIGLLALFEKLLKDHFTFRGKMASVSGYLNTGDIGEANSDSWRHRPDHKLSAKQSLKEIIRLMSQENIDEYQQVLNLVMLTISGNAENMDDVLSGIADYLLEYLEPALQSSELKYLLAALTGNHIGNNLDRHGIKELAYFKQRLKAKGIGYFEVGVSGSSVNNTDPNVRVAIGGYETANCLSIERYGLSKDNEPLFGPINLFMIHDPKGSGKTGIVGAGKNANADLALAGHTHDSYSQASRTSDNNWRMALRVPTMQKVTATEIVYASSEPRTTGAVLFIMPSPGDFSEIFLDINKLRQIGKEKIESMIKESE